MLSQLTQSSQSEAPKTKAQRAPPRVQQQQPWRPQAAGWKLGSPKTNLQQISSTQRFMIFRARIALRALHLCRIHACPGRALSVATATSDVLCVPAIDKRQNPAGAPRSLLSSCKAPHEILGPFLQHELISSKALALARPHQ